MSSPRFAPGIRAKVLLASSALLLIPWIGYAFVAEMERFLRDGQARMLSDNARAVATLVQERSHVTAGGTRIPRDIAPPLAGPIELDGVVDQDWLAQGADVRGYGGERLAELHGAWTPQSLSFSHAVGRHGDHVYAFFDVSDDRVVYCAEGDTGCDHVRVSVQYSGERLQRHVVSAAQPGPVSVRTSEAAKPIEGVWRERERGYTVELKLPAAGLQQLAFAVADADEPAGNIAAVIVTEERLAEERTGFEATADVAAVLEGMSRANLRIWLVDGIGNVVLRTGTLQAAPPPEPPTDAIGKAIEVLREALVSPPRRGFVDPLAQASRLDTAEIEWALAGQPVSRVNERLAAGSRIDAAAHPIQIKGETVGAVLVEQSSESIARIRELALERLLLATLAAFVCGALILIIYVSHVSSRLRKLRDEAERAIDSAGRVRELAVGSTSGDEIGDLSRSYSAVLKRLAQYTDYLEHLARRLNHELRTPIAVVRSSLDNLRSEASGGSTVYIERAEAGLDRLAAILSRMSEATRLEEIMGRAERETFDLNAVVRGCAEGYRLAYAPLEIRYRGPDRPIGLSGLPDLIAQMLDKLVENAAEHATPSTPVDIVLEAEDVTAVLRVRNEGAPLPAAMEGRLFESMVSVQEGKASGIPHLGLGLYIVKLIAQFHHGAASAANRSDKTGVEVTVRLARYLSDPA